MMIKNALQSLKMSLLAGCVSVVGLGLTSTAIAEDLDKVKEDGVLRIAMSGAYPPFNFVNNQNEVVGFDPAIGKEIGKRMGVEVEVITTAWDGIIAGLLANKYDAVVGSMSITEERQKVIDFVGPYYTTRRAMFTKADSDITTLEEAAEKRMGVTLGETHEDWARQNDYKIRTYKGLPELLLELDNGRVDVIVNDDIAAILAIKENDYDFVQVELPEAESQPISAGIAIRKGNPELAAAMQAALDEMMEDGTYLEIAEEWIGADIR